MMFLFAIAIIVTIIGLITSVITMGVILSDMKRQRDFERKLP